MFDTLYGQIGAFLMVTVCSFAFIKGDQVERIGAGTYLLAWFSGILVQDDAGLYKTQWGLFAIDLAVLAVFCGLAWKSRRTWPIWASALQLLPVMSHIMTRIDMRPPASAFFAVMNLAGLGIMAALAIGTFWAWQERRAAGLE